MLHRIHFDVSSNRTTGCNSATTCCNRYRKHFDVSPAVKDSVFFRHRRWHYTPSVYHIAAAFFAAAAASAGPRGSRKRVAQRHSCYICAATGRAPPTSAPGLGLTPETSARTLGSPGHTHLHRDQRGGRALWCRRAHGLGEARHGVCSVGVAAW